MKIYSSYLANDLANFVVYTNEKGLIFIKSDRDLEIPFEFQASLDSPYEFTQKENEHSKAAKKQLDEYLEGERHVFDLPIDLIFGSPLQREVWQELAKIPYGETWSYSQLAEALERPKAVRSIASAVGKNPMLIIYPCHRVLRKNGELGGYRSGLSFKADLIKLEKREII